MTYSRVIARKVEKDMQEGDRRDKIVEELDLIGSESMRCGRIVKDLLTYARESPHEFKTEHLHELVERVTNLAGHHLQLGSVEVNVLPDLADDTIVCDGDQIVQALLALMINAVEAMPEGGQLTLRTAPGESDPERQVLLAVEDTGSGIPEAIRGRILDPFFSTKAETSGVGLGLAVVYGIVSRHGGTIGVESGPEPGATFLLNSPYPADEIWDHLPIEAQEQLIEKRIKFFVIYGNRVAREAQMGVGINTVMQTGFFKLAEVLAEEEAVKRIKEAIEKTYGKKGGGKDKKGGPPAGADES